MESHGDEKGKPQTGQGEQGGRIRVPEKYEGGRQHEAEEGVESRDIDGAQLDEEHCGSEDGHDLDAGESQAQGVDAIVQHEQDDEKRKSVGDRVRKHRERHGWMTWAPRREGSKDVGVRALVRASQANWVEDADSSDTKRETVQRIRIEARDRTTGWRLASI